MPLTPIPLVMRNATRTVHVRKAEDLAVGDTVTARLTVDV